MNFKMFLKSAWELPQLIGAEIIKKLFKATEYTTYKDAKVYTWSRKEGLSMSTCIFVPFTKDRNPNDEYVQNFIKHEYGHTIQSKYLGWLYLLIIGIPSATWCHLCKEYRKKNNVSYYSFYTESWANKLGGSNFT